MTQRIYYDNMPSSHITDPVSLRRYAGGWALRYGDEWVPTPLLRADLTEAEIVRVIHSLPGYAEVQVVFWTAPDGTQ